MALSIFSDKVHPPSKTEIVNVLGKRYSQWIDLLQYFRDHFTPGSETWKNYGKSSGWTLLLNHKDRTIFYLFPNKEYFTVLFVYSEKAVRAAEDAELPENILQQILLAKNYPEGRSFNIEVKSDEDVIHVKKLIKIKVMN